MQRDNDWEGAVEDRIQALEAQLDEKNGQIKAMQAVVEAYEAEKNARDARDRQDFVSGLKQQAVDFGCALEADQVELIEKAFARGDSDGAKALGEVFLRSAKAIGSSRSGAPLQGLAPTYASGPGSAESVTNAKQALFAAAGIKE